MIDHEALVLVVVEVGTVELPGGHAVEEQGDGFDFQGQVVLVASGGGVEAETEGSAAAGEGDAQALPRGEVPAGGIDGGGGESDVHSREA